MATDIASATTEGYDLEIRARANVATLSNLTSTPENINVLKTSSEEQGVSPEQLNTYVQNLNNGQGNEAEFIKIIEVTSSAFSKLGINSESVSYVSDDKIIPFSTVTTSVFEEDTLIIGNPSEEEVATQDNSWAQFLSDLEQANRSDELSRTEPFTNYYKRMNLNSIYTGDPQNVGRMYKMYPKNEPFKEIEIYPALKKPSGTSPFLIKMVDKYYKNAGIYIDPGYVIWGISLTPTPNSMTISGAKIVNRYQTMTRWVEEHWGDEIDTINFSGSSFSFFAYKLQSAPDVGLTTQYRNDTAAYRILREFENIFRYNGLIFQDESTYEGMNALDVSQSGVTSKSLDNPVQNFVFADNDTYFQTHHPLTGLAKERLYINIYFDYVSFLGYFEAFDLIEDSSKPFQFNYSAVFRAEKTKWHQGYRATESV